MIVVSDTSALTALLAVGEAEAIELERELVRDLQFIRVNGTVVGGLVGLLIYSASHALK